MGQGRQSKVVGIETADGKEEIVLHTSALDNQGGIEVGVLGYDHNNRAFIELPRKSASGRWRVWVDPTALMTE